MRHSVDEESVKIGKVYKLFTVATSVTENVPRHQMPEQGVINGILFNCVKLLIESILRLHVENVCWYISLYSCDAP